MELLTLAAAAAAGALAAAAPRLTRAISRRAAAAFGYAAVESRGKRRLPAASPRTEDAVLNASQRDRLTENARDLDRNFSVAAWAIRRHLDYVATFDFHARTPDRGLNTELEALVREWSGPAESDVCGRHRLGKQIRLAEARRCLDGDAFLLKLADGRLQGIESDRIRTPPTTEPGSWVHGVKVDAAGRPLAYAVHRVSEGNRYELERIVPASRVFALGYYTRWAQVRGVSPLASALNPLRDVYEAADYALAKAKVTQLWALAIYSSASDGIGLHEPDLETDPDGSKARYKYDADGGPQKLELDPGDRAEFLESRHPSTEFQAFLQNVLTLALKALDIPYSFFDESHTNFFGSRGAWLHYERACLDKREDLAELLRGIYRWRLGLWVADGTLRLPRSWTFNDLAKHDWASRGMPWWKPSEEIRGDLMAVGAGLDTPQRICRERGRGDFEDNLAAIAQAHELAAEYGLRLTFTPPPDGAAAQPLNAAA